MTPWRTPWTPLQDGQILDCGYQEFMCSRATAASLLAGGMSRVNDTDVVLSVVDEFPAANAVVVRWVSASGDNLATEWARYWAATQTEAA